MLNIIHNKYNTIKKRPFQAKRRFSAKTTKNELNFSTVIKPALVEIKKIYIEFFLAMC